MVVVRSLVVPAAQFVVGFVAVLVCGLTTNNTLV
jgi:hypothetical protein